MPTGLRNPQILAAVIGAITTVVVTVVSIVPSIITATQPPSPTPSPIVIVITPVPATQAVIEPTSIPTAVMNLPSVTPLPIIDNTQAPTAITVQSRTDPSQAANLHLMYDNVSFTLRSESDDILSLEGMSFRSDGGSWDARGWGPSIYTSLPSDRCLRLRDASAGQRQPPAPCVNKIYGLIEVGSPAFFWINVEQFMVIYNGEVIATCEVAAGECAVHY
jgi:hypothetical protein